MNSTQRFLLNITLFFASFGVSLADDPGITKVRLIQQSDSVYLLEADVPQMLLNTISLPVFPARFKLSDFDYTNQSGWITLKLIAVSKGEGLMPDDEILLPWLRNGIDFTARWEDGTTFKGFFTRSMNGIHIPMKELMPVSKTTGEVLTEGFFLGIKHVKFLFIHVLLIIMLVWTFSRRSVYRYLLWFSFGQFISLILTELRIPAFDLLLSDWILLAFIFVLSNALAYKRQFRFTGIVLFICGLLHGLAFSHDLLNVPLLHVQRVQELFAFNLAIDLCHYLLAFIFSFFIVHIKRSGSAQKWFPIGTGAIAVFLILLIFRGNIITGKTEILDLSSSRTTSIRQSAPRKAGATQVRRGTGAMTTPIVVYLSVEPYELRQEVLIEANEALKVLLPGYKKDMISVDLQDQIKNKLKQAVLESNSLYVNNKIVQPGESKANFVSLSRGGVYIREKSQEESREEGIIGITFIYDIESFPESVSVDWNFFPDSNYSIEASVVDPHGNFTTRLNPEHNEIKWVTRLPGYQPAAVKPITIKRYPLPIISFLFWIGIIAILLYYLISRKEIKHKTILILIVVIGFLLYPFFRFESKLVPQGKPSTERTGIILNDLLSNVYRAFDRRNEDAVYDKLEMSVTGNQLTTIYLENRRALALENRGGARANVDEIKIIDVMDVFRTDDNTIVAEASWTVRGSVSHFGHTHYRKNHYHALVSFINENEVWKIVSIETIEEKRLF